MHFTVRVCWDYEHGFCVDVVGCFGEGVPIVQDFSVIDESCCDLDVSYQQLVVWMPSQRENSRHSSSLLFSP